MKKIFYFIITSFLTCIYFSCSETINDNVITVNISGNWEGVAYGFSDIPEEPNPRIKLELKQQDSTVHGTLTVRGSIDTVDVGKFINNNFTMILENDYEKIKYEFTANLSKSRLEGIYKVKNLTTDLVYYQNNWYVEKKKF